MKQSNSQRQRHTHKQELGTQLELTTHGLQVAMAILAEKGLAEFEEAVRKEMDENPALEEKDGWDNEVDRTGMDDDPVGETSQNGDSDEIGRDDDYDKGRDDAPHDDDGLELSDYVGSEPQYAQDFVNEIGAINSQTFYESLVEQMNDYNLSDEDQEIMRYLISSLDSNGYLTKEVVDVVYEVSFRLYINTTEEHVEHLLNILHNFEPHGLGARSLQECLLIQVKALPASTPLRDVAIRALSRYFDLFATLDWTTLQRRLRLSDDDFEHIKRLLMRLNPKPGNQLNMDLSTQAPTVVPDFVVEVNAEGELVVSLNNGGVPELCVSPSYVQTIKDFGQRKTKLSKEMEDQLVFVQSKIDAAKNFINLVNLRRRALLNVAEEIADLQRDFFLNDDDETLLKPLKLEDIAQRLAIDVSTVSRVVRNKFVQTIYGTYPIKKFFSFAFTTDEGVEISSHHAMLKLQEIVDGEDKAHPYSDELLALEMKNAGFPVARRTIAKYRERLHIPEKRLRRKK